MNAKDAGRSSACGCHSGIWQIPDSSEKMKALTCFRSVATKFMGQRALDFYIDEKAKIRPLILGGGQQKGMRSGTDNVPGAAGLGVAAEEAYDHFEEKQAYLYQLKEFFMEGVCQASRCDHQFPAGKRECPPDCKRQLCRSAQ